VETAIQTCYRHPDRRAGVVCQRCDRPICPDCMHQASVGFHCPECARSGAQKVLRPADLVERPVVAIAIVAVNLLVFVVGIGPGLATRPAVIGDGGLFGPFVAQGEWWRVITSGFLHANVIHVGFNSFLAYQLGLLLEPVFGRLRFALVYAAGLFAGGFGALLLTPDAFTVGASGAVFGLMGAAVVVLRNRRIDVFATGIGGLLVLNLVLTFVIPRISIGGHLGGLAGGALAGWILVELAPRLGRNQAVASTALVAALCLTGLAGALAVA
jgi:membrane associated rhomboid family serine protease